MSIARNFSSCRLQQGYSGAYPRMMLVHGTADATISFNDLREAVKQWTGLHGLDANKPTKTETLPNESNYQVTYYGGNTVMAIAAGGVTHDNPAKVDLTCQFFGI